MVRLDKWFIANKLTLNAKKTSFTIFRSSRSRIKDLPDKLIFNNSEINRSSSVTYLGVLLDEHLTFKNHVQKVCNSIKMFFKVFYNIRRYLDTKQIEILYYSLIYSRIKYGIIIYGYSSKKILRKSKPYKIKYLKFFQMKITDFQPKIFIIVIIFCMSMIYFIKKNLHLYSITKTIICLQYLILITSAFLMSIIFLQETHMKDLFCQFVKLT